MLDFDGVRCYYESQLAGWNITISSDTYQHIICTRLCPYFAKLVIMPTIGCMVPKTDVNGAYTAKDITLGATLYLFLHSLKQSMLPKIRSPDSFVNTPE